MSLLGRLVTALVVTAAHVACYESHGSTSDADSPTGHDGTVESSADVDTDAPAVEDATTSDDCCGPEVDGCTRPDGGDTSGSCAGPFRGCGCGGGSGATCLASYSFDAIAGRTYTISTCGSYTGDPYLRVSGACACVNDDSCGLGTRCRCTATSTGPVTICASAFGGECAGWSYVVIGDC